MTLDLINGKKKVINYFVKLSFLKKLMNPTVYFNLIGVKI